MFTQNFSPLKCVACYAEAQRCAFYYPSLFLVLQKSNTKQWVLVGQADKGMIHKVK